MMRAAVPSALPTDHFLYYLTVVRFCYAVLEKGAQP